MKKSMETVSYIQKVESPFDKAGYFSSVLFWWTYKVIRKGHKKQFEVEDLPEPARNDHAHGLGNKVEQAWLHENKSRSLKNEGKPSLLNVIVKVFWKEFIFITAIHCINDFFLAIWKQILLGLFLVYLKESEDSEDAVFKLRYTGVFLIVAFALNSLLQNHFLCKSVHLGGRIKIALTSLIYRKCLRLRMSTSEDATVGQVLNLLTNDLRQFDQIIIFAHYIWSGMMSTCIVLAVIVYYFGIYPAIACLIAVVISMPVQVLISKALARNRVQTASASDKRIQAMDEIIGGIQIIKMYAWEKPYEKFVEVLRRAEMHLVRKTIYLRGFQVGLSLFTSKFSLYILVVMFALIGGEIVPERVFLLAGYCSIFARVLSGMCFRSFGECGTCLVSIRRIQTFLQLKEYKKPFSPPKSEAKDTAIQISNGTANWSVDSGRNALKDICVTVHSGTLTTVIGEVGSGKSSLLNVILGELPLHEGKFVISGTVSYYCQSPWIFPGTIRQNILFTEDFEKSRYDRVVEACALDRDFNVLPDEDFTLVGEKGVNLSGGQKARIALARAVYKRADVYLLDDPLSAVDSRVSKRIFDECILEFLKGRTRILVTHQLQFLTSADQVVLLQQGKVVAQGSVNDIMDSNANIIDTLKELNLSRENQDRGDKLKRVYNYSRHLVADSTPLPTSVATKKELEKEETTKAKRNALIKYMIGGTGIAGVWTVFILCILTQISFVAFDVWLQRWTQFTEDTSKNDTTLRNGVHLEIFDTTITTRQYYIGVYTLIFATIVVLIFVRNTAFAYCGQNCAKQIHRRSFRAVLYTDVGFFHNNPSGRILNRFSKDLGTVDDLLVSNLLDAVTSMLQVMAAFIISAAIDIWYMPSAIIAFLSLFAVRSLYLKTSRNLKRVESVAKSPVFVHLQSTFQGLPIIRSSDAASKLVDEFDRCQDVHTSGWLLYNYISFGYAWALEIIGIVYLIVIVIGSMSLTLSRSLVGLSLTQVVILLNFIQWAMKQTAEVSNQVTSVDRLLKYCSLPGEVQPRGQKRRSVKNWPANGRIMFENVGLRYNTNATLSIQDVTFTIQPQQKIGIVGRTGSGKSSLLAALFRLGIVEGKITIDGIDTADLRLQKLRSHISVIPQDPILFSGTLRKNLDPFNEYEDAALWKALEEAELKRVFMDEDGPIGGLSLVVSENGRNFSVGQRQLICLARAILRNNKILVLDEATANVDQKTDNIIQKTIRERFKSCTVLTVAHRLNTVVDSDKILVMDDGYLLEFDHPYALLKDSESLFYRLVSETGQSMAATLTSIAKDKFEQLNSENVLADDVNEK